MRIKWHFSPYALFFFISPSFHSVLLKHSRYFRHSTRLVLVTHKLRYLQPASADAFVSLQVHHGETSIWCCYNLKIETRMNWIYIWRLVTWTSRLKVTLAAMYRKKNPTWSLRESINVLLAEISWILWYNFVRKHFCDSHEHSSFRRD